MSLHLPKSQIVGNHMSWLNYQWKRRTSTETSFYFALFIAEDMIQDMMQPEFRNYIKELSSSKYGVDLGQKKQSMPTVASFRKLNID